MPVKEAVTRTKFEKVGDSVSKVTTASSRGVQKGILVRKGNSKGGMIAEATAVHRANIQEKLGAQFTPTATLYAQNSASASDVQRNTRIVPSAVGNKDFYLKRQYGQVLQ